MTNVQQKQVKESNKKKKKKQKNQIEKHLIKTK